jgi:hypothetical protein
MVKRSQGRMSRWGSNEHIGSVEKVRRKDRGVGVWSRGRGKGTGKSMTELGKEMAGVVFRIKRKLSRKNQGHAVNGFSRGKVGGIMGGRTIGKENPRKVCNPIRWGATGPKCGFEAPVKPFQEAIGLRVESCGGDVGHVEESGEVGP